MIKLSQFSQTIGNTPLARINLDASAQCYAKLEYLNPGGSIKDRSALFMIEQAEKDGRLKPGKTIIDASSGNHGISIAMIGAAKGYPVIICVSEKISHEKLTTIKAYGAQVVMCTPTEFIEDPRSYHSTARRLHEETPDSFFPNQYFSTQNRLAHYTLLGPEIWQQTEGRITHFFAAAGTGGTISGAGRYLKEQNPNIKIIALDSINSFRSTGGHPKPYKVEGMGIDFESGSIDYAIIDDFVTVSDTEALGILAPLAQKTGFLVGPSSGAVASGVSKYACNLNHNDYVVMIFGDSGRAYLSKGFYSAVSEAKYAPTLEPHTQHNVLSL